MSRWGHHLLMHQYVALDLACRPLERAFVLGVYLVGSCMTRSDYRDVDVRAIVEDDAFARMYPDADPDKPHQDPYWKLVCMAMSRYLSDCSGLPVDFQIQQMTMANRDHPGKRSALGLAMEPSAG